MAVEETFEMLRSTYFVRPNRFIAVTIMFGLWLTYCCCFSPDLAPHRYLGPLGTLYAYLAFESHPFWKYSIFVFAVVMHVGESFIALYVTQKKGVTDPLTRFKWWLATLVCGFESLRRLLKLKEKES